MSLSGSSQQSGPTDLGTGGRKYHHGDLRAALLRAGEEELAEKGCAGFSLRGTAKRAGVSHAAPAYHFSDVQELRTALAAHGFERLAAAMRSEQGAAAANPHAQLVAAAIGYFRFGLENPALLSLMFETKGLDEHRCLRQGAADVVGILAGSVSALRRASALSSSQERTLVAAVWSVVHGFTSIAFSNGLNVSRGDDRRTFEGELMHILAAILPGPAAPARPWRGPRNTAGHASSIQA
jgi:AcrR family transcriptional regulator